MEKFYAATKDLKLSQYFEDCSDVRVQLRDLFERTRQVVQREKEINLEVVLLIGALERQNPAVNLGLWGGRDELAEKLGLTRDQYLKRAQAGRVLWRHPELIGLIRNGKTYVSHVGMLASKITEANKDIFIQEIVGKSERQVRELIASVNKDGSRNGEKMTFDLRLTLTKAQLNVLERAREVLSAAGRLPSDEETVALALADLLEKRDPVRKAERAEVRKEKKARERAAVKHEIAEAAGNAGTADKLPEIRALKHGALEAPSTGAARSKVKPRRVPIPAALKHQVMLRDNGACTHIDSSGRRCGARVAVQIDHLLPVALGGGNDLGNLRLLCREHNIIAAQVMLGEGVMASYLGTATT